MKYFRLFIITCLLVAMVYFLWQCSQPDSAGTLELPGATPAPAK